MNVLYEFGSVYDTLLPHTEAAILKGIVLGIKPGAELNNITNAFRNAGVLHIMVLSGSNIAILVRTLEITLQKIRPIQRVTVITTFILFFLFIVGLQAPALRAGIMAILPMIGLVFGLPTHVWYMMLLVVLIVSIFTPSLLYSASFHLSMLAVIGILLFGKTYEDKNIFLAYIKNQISISLAAQTFTMPYIFALFHQIQPYALVTNVLIGWIVSPLMVGGLLTLLIGRYVPLLPGLLYIGIRYILYTVWFITSLPLHTIYW